MIRYTFQLTEEEQTKKEGVIDRINFDTDDQEIDRIILAAMVKEGGRQFVPLPSKDGHIYINLDHVKWVGRIKLPEPVSQPPEETPVSPEI